VSDVHGCDCSATRARRAAKPLTGVPSRPSSTNRSIVQDHPVIDTRSATDTFRTLNRRWWL